MFFNFLIPEFPILWDATPFITAYIVDSLFILTYAWIARCELGSEWRFAIVTLSLIPLNLLMFFFTLIATDIVEKVAQAIINAEEPVRILGDFADTSIGAIPSGAILGYASSFAFAKVSRKHLIISWIAANSISTLIVAVFFVPHFCGLSPYRC